MSQQPRVVVDDAYSAFDKGDVPSLLGLLSDDVKWNSPEALPHGRDAPETQPILLSTEPVPANGATNIALADGLWREEALGFAQALAKVNPGGSYEVRPIAMFMPGNVTGAAPEAAARAPALAE